MGMRSYRRPGTANALRAAQAGQPAHDGVPADQLSMGTGTTVFSYLIAGMLTYGGLGWVIGHFTHVSLLFPVGMLIGLAIAIGWIVYHYGRPQQLGNPPKGDDR